MHSAQTSLPKEEGGSRETSAEGSGAAAEQVGEEQLHPDEASGCRTSEALPSLDCKTTGNASNGNLSKQTICEMCSEFFSNTPIKLK